MDPEGFWAPDGILGQNLRMTEAGVQGGDFLRVPAHREKGVPVLFKFLI